MKKSYSVALEGWVLGEYRLVGQSVEATKEEAKYLLMSGQLTTEKPSAVRKAAKAVDKAAD